MVACSACSVRPLVLLVLLAAAGAAGAAGAATRPRLKEADINRILANNRIVNAYVRCLLDKEPCSPDGAELKRALPDALATGCAQCSASERLLSEKVILHLMRRRKADWQRLAAKYDPAGRYAKRYMAAPASRSSKRPPAA